MKIFTRTPITNPGLGFLLGLAAFFLSFLLESVTARFVEAPQLTGFLMWQTGLFLLLFSTGSLDSIQRFLRADLGSFLGGFTVFGVMLSMAFSEEPFIVQSYDRLAFSILYSLVIGLLYSSIFASVTFGSKACRSFTLVFTPAAIPVYFLIKKWTDTGYPEDALSRLIAQVTQIHPSLTVLYLSVGALSGLSIALFNRRVINESTLP